MTFIRLFGLSILFALVPLVGADARDTKVPLTALIDEVNAALLTVQEYAEAEDLPPLHEVTLEVNTVMDIDAEGKVSLYIVEFGQDVKNAFTNTSTIVLIPAKPGTESNVGALEISDILAESILAGAQAIQHARDNGPVPLTAKSYSTEIKFGITVETNGKVSLNFPSFEISAGGAITQSNLQRISIAYKVSDN